MIDPNGRKDHPRATVRDSGERNALRTAVLASLPDCLAHLALGQYAPKFEASPFGGERKRSVRALGLDQNRRRGRADDVVRKRGPAVFRNALLYRHILFEPAKNAEQHFVDDLEPGLGLVLVGELELPIGSGERGQNLVPGIDLGGHGFPRLCGARLTVHCTEIERLWGGPYSAAPLPNPWCPKSRRRARHAASRQ